MHRILFLAYLLSVAFAHTRSTFDASEFMLLGPAPPSSLLRFTAALPSLDSPSLEARLRDVSETSSAEYGRWLSDEEAAALFSACPRVRARVREWLSLHGATCEDLPSALSCEATVADFEGMMAGTRINAYRGLGGAYLLRADPHSAPLTIPAALEGDLLFISGVADFPTRRMRGGARRATGLTLKANDLPVALESVSALYGAVSGHVGNSTTVAPVEFQNDDAVEVADLHDFVEFEGARPWTIARKVGPFSGSDTESTLDEEYVAGVSNGTATNWFWVEKAWLFDWVQALAAANRSDIPDVFSVSWGWFEGGQCDTDATGGPCDSNSSEAASLAYVDAVNIGLLAAAARGITIVVAAGYAGAHGRSDPSCSAGMTRPDFPASSPYVLSVGGTQLTGAATPLVAPRSKICQQIGTCAGAGVQVTCSAKTGGHITTGGGFSVRAPQPAWQAVAVASYLASGALLPPRGDFNASARAFPDVAAVAHNVMIYQNGGLELVDGTSASAPIIAGYIAAANAARKAAGKNVLGFVNPALYGIAKKTPSAFTDVLIGDNACAETCKAGCTGFGAAEGWDAVSGWGTVVAAVLLPELERV